MLLSPDQKYLQIKNTNNEWEPYPHCVFLKHFITKTDIISVGDYTYYATTANEKIDAADFENTNVLYGFPGAKLTIGKFCQLAQDCKFMMKHANHAVNAGTTYPLFWNHLSTYDNYFEAASNWETSYNKPCSDTVIGNDVWIGYDALILPGITIGDGAIIGARSVVTKNVEPYTIVGGNPARVIRQRFDDTTINTFLALKWWDWRMEKIMDNYHAIMAGDLTELEKTLGE